MVGHGHQLRPHRYLLQAIWTVPQLTHLREANKYSLGLPMRATETAHIFYDTVPIIVSVDETTNRSITHAGGSASTPEVISATVWARCLSKRYSSEAIAANGEPYGSGFNGFAKLFVLIMSEVH